MGAESDPDQILALRVQDGDFAAFEALVEKYRQPIIQFAFRMLRDFTEAEDMAQNVFLQAFRESGRFRFEARFSTWLYAIARNLCRNELRRRSRHRIADQSGVEDGPAERAHWPFARAYQPSPPETLVERELQERFDRALASLPEAQRAAILLLREGDISYQEIAMQLGHSLSATKTLIHRGRHALKRKLKTQVAYADDLR